MPTQAQFDQYREDLNDSLDFRDEVRQAGEDQARIPGLTAAINAVTNGSLPANASNLEIFNHGQALVQSFGQNSVNLFGADVDNDSYVDFARANLHDSGGGVMIPGEQLFAENYLFAVPVAGINADVTPLHQDFYQINLDLAEAIAPRGGIAGVNGAQGRLRGTLHRVAQTGLAGQFGVNSAIGGAVAATHSTYSDRQVLNSAGQYSAQVEAQIGVLLPTDADRANYANDNLRATESTDAAQGAESLHRVLTGRFR